MPIRQATLPRSTPLPDPISPGKFFTGAKPSPAHKLLGATPFLGTVAPAQFGIVPPKLSIWGNSTYGDCHDAETEVLTEHGWKKWPDYDGHSLLGTMNQSTGHLEFQAPSRVVRKEYKGLMAYSNHRRLDFVMTPGHRLFMRHYSRSKNAYQPYGFCRVDSLPCQFSLPLSTTGFLGTTLKRLVIGEREWDGSDLLKLLAVLVSDGWIGEKNAIEFCCYRDDRYDKIAALAYRLGIKQDPNIRRWRFSDGPLAAWLRANAFTDTDRTAQTKKVPDLVKVASQPQIEEFLDFFGDQTTISDNSRNFCSTSKRMIDDIQELLLRVGKAGTVYDGYTHKGVYIKGRWVECNNPCYTLHEATTNDVCLHQVKSGNGKSDIHWDNYTGEVFCATVPNSTLVTRRNGRALISSNCVSAEEAFAKACHTPEIFIDDSTVVAWARKHGFLNGADLSEVMDMMGSNGFQVGTQTYNDGPKQGVDFSNESVLQAAIAQGNVKIAIDAGALPSTAGNQQGWFALGDGRTYRSTDHCTGLSGYGTAGYLYSLLGVPLPSGVDGNLMGYLHFTWATIGFVTHAWLMSTCTEAWVRSPTTVGVPPIPDPSIVWYV